jgi:hypothetical protein
MDIKHYRPGTRRSRWVTDDAWLEQEPAIDVLNEVYTWIQNWDPNFIHDDEWVYTEDKIKEVLGG